LQADGKPEPGMHLEILKAKWEYFLNIYFPSNAYISTEWLARVLSEQFLNTILDNIK
jgi:hypothetical protein